MRTTDLAVSTRNCVNLKAMEVQQRLASLLTPYLGKKVRKISGSGGWVAALAPKLQAFSAQLQAEGFRCFVGCEYSWISVDLDTTYKVAELVGGGHAVDYVKAHVSLARIDPDTGELLHLFDPADLRTDYTLQWVEQTREKARLLESEARELRSQLREFDR